MRSQRIRRLALCGLLLLLAARPGRAQAPAAPPCCGDPRPHAHRGIGPRSWWDPNMPSTRAARHGPGPIDAGRGYDPGLPRGRRYYGGRYFGSFNNRFYGPQYGNF